MKIVSYYTKNTPYEKIMDERLRPTLERWRLPYIVKAIPDLGSWQANTSYKADFLLEMLEFGEDVCFLDADAEIVQYPTEIMTFDNTKFDLGVHYLDWFLQWRGKSGDKMELLSGTMIWGKTTLSKALCEEYAKACKSQKDKWEQRVLQDVIEGFPELRIYALPPEYCVVIKHDNSIPPHIKDPVIIHYQASRKYKNRG